ncbi:MAG: zf-TFIIB domain-containing protein [Polyangiaceae bacterium]|nr:zf-TFIIB domain-containing protein [Polyangiaceae bacterium]
MSTAYREQALRCPGCGVWLEPQPVDASTVDLCPSCGGVWIDWFDGELRAMAKEATRAAPRPEGESGAAGDSACPRCRAALQPERYLGTPAAVLRCGDCAGAFVPRESLPTLLRVEILAGEPAPRGALARLVEAVRSLLKLD